MTDRYDIIIVGGAAMGSSVAFHILADEGFRGRVLVIEKDPSYRRSASALSAASIRQQFSTSINIRISLEGIRFLREVGERLSVTGETPVIGLKEQGYLYLGEPATAPILAENQSLQVAHGADIVLLDRSGLLARFPWLATDDLACGTWGRSGEGWFDGWGLLHAFRRAARARGAEYRTGEVTAVERTGERIGAVRLADGSRLACGAVVNCAGAGGRALAALAGVALPVEAKRRDVFAFTCRERIANCPLVIDLTGVWWRPEGEDGFIAGLSPRSGEGDPDWRDDDAATQEPDWSVFEERIWPALARRVPAFATIRPGRAWSGPYDMNLFDHNAIVGRSEGVENFFLCNGFSGHGMQQSPAVGRALAELILHGRWLTLDLSDLGHDRIAANRSLLERNVI